MSIKNIIFDFDGTLVDTAPLIVSTMKAAIAELGLPSRTDAECRSTIGLRLEDAPRKLWPDMEGLGEIFASTYRKHFDLLKRPFNVKSFPGVEATLRELMDSGYNLAIASSRSHRSLREYCESFDMTDLFRMLVGGDDVAMGKPNPDPVLSIIDAMGWNRDETLMVGDADVDIMMGKAAGLQTCGVTYGCGTPDELKNAGADIIISEFPLIHDVIKKYG